MSRKSRKLRRSSLLDRVTACCRQRRRCDRAIRLTSAAGPAQAFPLFARAARAGIAEAEYRVGRCYLEGSGVPVSLTEGVRWLGYAAAQDHVEAQWLLAVLCIHGTARAPTAVQRRACFRTKTAPKPDFAAGEKWARPGSRARVRGRTGSAGLHPDLRPRIDAQSWRRRTGGMSARPQPDVLRARWAMRCRWRDRPRMRRTRSRWSNTSVAPHRQDWHRPFTC